MARRKNSRLQRNIHLLRALQTAKPSRRRELLKSADQDLIQALADCAFNLLQGNVPLDSKRKRTLKKYKRELLQVSNPKASLKAKRRIVLNQRGGFLGSLLPALLGPVLTAVSRLVKG